MKAYALVVHGSEEGIVFAAKWRKYSKREIEEERHAQSEREIEERHARREALPRDLKNAGLIVEEGHARYLDYFDKLVKNCDSPPHALSLHALSLLVQSLSEEKYLREYIDDAYVGPLRVAREGYIERSKGGDAMRFSFYFGISTQIERTNSNSYLRVARDATRLSEGGYAMQMSYPRGLESEGWPAKWPWLSEHWRRDTHATFPTAFRLRIRTLVLCLKVTYADELPGDILDHIVKQAATTHQLWY